TPEDLAAAAPLIQAFATPEQREQFRVLAATLHTSRNVMNAVVSGDQNTALEAIQLAESPENRLELTTPAKNKLKAVATERIATINRAVSSGDYTAAAGSDLVRDTTAVLFTAPLPDLQRRARDQQV